MTYVSQHITDNDVFLYCTTKGRSRGSKPWTCWTRICPAFASSVDPDQSASAETDRSGSAVCHSGYEFIWTIWIKQFDWLTIRSGRGINLFNIMAKRLQIWVLYEKLWYPTCRLYQDTGRYCHLWLFFTLPVLWVDSADDNFFSYFSFNDV